jgi:hypothetical protein
MFGHKNPESMKDGREPMGHTRPDLQAASRERAFADYWRRIDGLPPLPPPGAEP